MSKYIGSKSTGTLKRISNNVKYGSGELKDMRNLRQGLMSSLFITQPYELGRVLTQFDLKVSHYTN